MHKSRFGLDWSGSYNDNLSWHCFDHDDDLFRILADKEEKKR
jgi:hypothetical protein